MTDRPSAADTTTERTWIIGTDGSPGSAHAAEWAVQQAPGRAQHLLLASYWTLPIAPAIPPVGPMTKYWDVESFAAAAHEGVNALAEQLRSKLPDDIDVGTVVAEGQASSHLVAEAGDDDLLVVGSRGHGGFARLILGSTSTQCATHAKSPTAVIRDTAPVAPIEKIVVAFDGSTNSLDALDWALDFAAPGSTISVVQVWEPVTVPMGADQFVFVDAVDRTRDYFDEQTGKILAAVDTDARGITVTCEFAEGRIRHELAERAAESDLLVMGARGSGFIGAALLGSVSSWLLHNVETAMVVIPHHPAPDDD